MSYYILFLPSIAPLYCGQYYISELCHGVVDTLTLSLPGHPSTDILTSVHSSFSYSMRLKCRGLRMALRVIIRGMGILDFKVMLGCYLGRGDIRLVGVTIIRIYVYGIVKK